MVANATKAGTQVMAPKSVTFRQHDEFSSYKHEISDKLRHTPRLITTPSMLATMTLVYKTCAITQVPNII